MDDENVELLTVRRCIGAQALETLDVIFERIFDVGFVRNKSFRFIELVQELENERSKSILVEASGKRLADKVPRLLLIHVDLTKYEERITSRGLNMYALSCARVGWRNKVEMSRRKIPRTFSGSISFFSASATFLVVGRGRAPSVNSCLTR